MLTLPLALVFILRNEVPTEVTSRTFASQVSIVGRWYQTDRFRCASVLIAEVMCTLLHHIGIEVILIVDDDVVGWSNLSLKAGMRLEIKIEQERGRKAPILHRTRKSVAVVRFLFGCRWVKSAVVSLSTDHDGDLWFILRAPSNFPESLLDLRMELIFEYFLILSLLLHVSRLIDFKHPKPRTSLTPSL